MTAPPVYRPTGRPAGRKARILTYHRVGIPRGGRYESLTVSPDRFRRQLQALRRMGSTTVHLDAIGSWLRGTAPLAPKAIVLTFDDGYAELYEHAFPLLTEMDLCATIYLVSDRKKDSWRDAAKLPPLPLLDWSKVRKMAKAGVAFGSHTRTHRRLTECSPHELREEVLGSKKAIEDRLGQEVRHFCYPYGALDDRVADAVREAGYATACTTVKASVRPRVDPLRLPRWSVGKRMGTTRFLLRMVLRS